MLQVVFLDFDGVLHRNTTGTFRKLPQFCQFLRTHPDVRVVISSTWRLLHPLEELREFFETDVRHQIIDVTPDLTVMEGFIAVRTTRCEEIAAWLKAHPEVRYWAILDDEEKLFQKFLERLVLTDSSEGLVDADLVKLEARLREPV
jgi:hypothetical protein